jgi:hypothetical protein
MPPGKPRPTAAAPRLSPPEARSQQVFLLSPASCSGQRANLLTNPRTTFSLARRLRESPGAPLGDVFSFLSGLYFRGKLTYALAFGRPPQEVPPALVITTSRGLVDPQTPVNLADVAHFATVPIDVHDARYREPLLRDAQSLASKLNGDSRVVLLGSIATDKYVGVLSAAFGDRLVFPQEFVGRGDMSRGGLLLRAVDEGQELAYVPLHSIARRGPRPARLQPRPPCQ